MNFYSSNYLNVYVSHRRSRILFNGFTGAIDEVSIDLGECLKKYSQNGKPLPQKILSSMSENTVKFLKKRGHVTTLKRESEIDKFSKYVEVLNRRILEAQGKESSLMLVPSYMCNLACGYCYQNMLRDGKLSAKKVMTDKQVDFIFNNLMEQLFPKIKDKSNVSVLLYGGEPFLGNHLPALKRIIDYTTKYQMRVSAISNSTNTHKMIDLFGNEVGLVNSVQVSFDGGKECHDTSRIGLDGQPTFERIVKNIHLLLDKRVRVGIRINIDKKSAPTIPSLLQRLETEKILGHPLVKPYAWVIHSHYNQAKDNALLSPIELASYMEKRKIAIETPVGRREKRLRAVFDAVNGIPLKRTTFCMKCSDSSFVYDAYENIYACYEEAGHPEKRVGYVDENGKVIFNEGYSTALTRHVASIEQCRKCGLALTCGGGCPFAAKQKSGTIFSADCDNHKECLEKAVQNLFKNKTEHSKTNNPNNQTENLYPYA